MAAWCRHQVTEPARAGVDSEPVFGGVGEPLEARGVAVDDARGAGLPGTVRGVTNPVSTGGSGFCLGHEVTGPVDGVECLDSQVASDAVDLAKQFIVHWNAVRLAPEHGCVLDFARKIHA